jgi:hypothetical protein
MADLVSGGVEGEPANKRARLKSVVPAPAPVKKKAAAMGQPPTSPPRPVPPPIWLSGQLPQSQRGHGSGRQNPNQRGEDRCAAVRVAVTVAPTRDREGRSEGPARPLGPLVDGLKTAYSNAHRVRLYFERKNREYSSQPK